MSLLRRLLEFRKRRAQAKKRAVQKAAGERQNAALELALDDFLWDGRLPKDAYTETGYKSALGEGFEHEEDSREDW